MNDAGYKKRIDELEYKNKLLQGAADWLAERVLQLEVELHEAKSENSPASHPQERDEIPQSAIRIPH